MLAPEVREIVLGPGRSVLSEGPARVRQEAPGVAQLVQGDVAQGHVLLQFGAAGDPVAQPLREDQGVVPQAQRVLGHILCGLGQAGADLERDVLRTEGVAGSDAGGRRVGFAHRCFTPSLLV